MAVTLEQAKLHMRVEHDDEDAIIGVYLEAAEQYLGRIGVDMTVDPLPAPVAASVLLIVTHLYETREATAERPVVGIEYGVDRLIAPYRESVA